MFKTVQKIANALLIVALLSTTLTNVSAVTNDTAFEKAVYSPIWTPWQSNNGTTLDPIAMEGFELNGEFRLFQAVRGSGFPYWIYIRSTSDGKFDPESCLSVTLAQTDLECWDRVGINGQTSRQVSLVNFNSKMYLAVRGENSKIYTKSLDSSGVWSNWNENGGTTSNTIAQASFNGRLYQAVRGDGSDRMFMRSTNDGIFDGESDENWTELNGQTQDDMALSVFNSKLFMTVRGSTGRLFTRSTADGTTWGSWSEESSVLAKTPPVIVSHDNLIHMAITNYSGKILTKYSTNGTSWSSWVEAPGSSDSRVEMKSFDGNLYQTVRGRDNKIYTRVKLHLADGTMQFSKLIEFTGMSTGDASPYNTSFAFPADIVGSKYTGNFDIDANMAECATTSNWEFDDDKYGPGVAATAPSTEPSTFRIYFTLLNNCTTPLGNAERTIGMDYSEGELLESYTVSGGNVDVLVEMYSKPATTYLLNNSDSTEDVFTARLVWYSDTAKIIITIANDGDFYYRVAEDYNIVEQMAEDLALTLKPGNVE